MFVQTTERVEGRKMCERDVRCEGEEGAPLLVCKLSVGGGNN